MRSPFKFLDYFTKGDRESFFGRDKEIERLYELVKHHRLVLVYGPSGTGKTSLIRCGLANRFDATEWLEVYVKRGNHLPTALLAELKEKLRRGQEHFAESTDVVSLVDTLSSQYFRPVYLIFDQFEELFISGDQAEKDAFIEQIAAINEAGLSCRILLSVREEYIGRLYELEQAVPISYEQRLRVEPISGPVIREEVIEKSFGVFNMSLASPELADTIFNNLEGGERVIPLPYLQVYLDRLWTQSAEVAGVTAYEAPDYPDLSITAEQVKELGDLDKVFKDYLELKSREIQKEIAGDALLAQAHGEVPAELVNRVLDGLATEDGTKRVVSFSRKAEGTFGWNKLPDAWRKYEAYLQPVLEQLAAGRLVRLEARSVELAHDSLAAVIDGRRTAEERLLNDYRQQIRISYTHYKDPSDYFPAKKVAIFEDELEALNLAPELVNFLMNNKRYWEGMAVAKAANLRERREAAMEQERKLAAERLSRAEEKRKRNRWFSIVAGVLTIIAVGTAWWALDSRTVAEKALAEAKILRTQDSLSTIKAQDQTAIAERAKADALAKAAEAERSRTQDSLSTIKAQDQTAIAERAKADALAKAAEAERSRSRAQKSDSLAQMESIRFKREAAKGLLLGRNIGSSYDELIAVGQEQYLERKFQNALTYWANAQFVKPNSNEAATLVTLAKETIEADSLAHNGYWDMAEAVFFGIVEKNEVTELINFSRTRIDQLETTKLNWVEVEKELVSVSLDSVVVSLPLLSFPIDWKVAEERMSFLSFIPIGDKLFSIDRFIKLTDLSLRGSSVVDLSSLSSLTSLGNLDLSNSEVSDLSPLSGLTSLGNLDLSNSEVSDLSPLSGLTSLGDLDLRNSEVSDLSPLSGLTSLGDLNLSRSKVSDLRPLSGLTSLGGLDLSNSEINDLKPLSGLTNLGDLILFESKVSDLSPLSGLTSLGDLILFKSKVSDLSPLSGLTSLGDLYLYQSGISDLSSLSGLTSLGELDLRASKVSDLSPLSGLTSLGGLKLIGSKVSDLSPLSGLKSLGVLDLSDSEVSDLSFLSGLTSLGELNLSRSKVSDLSPLSGLTSLLVLNLGYTKVADLSPLSGLKSLGKLDLRDSKVSDLSPLSGLTSLGDLYLYKSKVSDLSPMSGLTSLGELDLRDSKVSDLSPLSGLTSLGDLYLYKSKVSDLSPLSGLTSLGELDLSYSKVSDLSPLSGLTSLGELDLRDSKISDLSPLSSLTSLGKLNLEDSEVSDLSPLFQVEKINTLLISKKQSSLPQLATFRAKHLDCEILIR